MSLLRNDNKQIFHNFLWFCKLLQIDYEQLRFLENPLAIQPPNQIKAQI